MAIAIPMLLGYHPEESLVVSCLRGPTVDLTMRFDLAALPPPEEFACELADRIEQAHADLTIVAVFTSERPVGGDLPLADLVDERYGDERLRLVEAVLVSGRRWWSYLCADPACCPPDGRALEESSDVAMSLSAAFALNGCGVLADRGALVNSIAFDPAISVGPLAITMARPQPRADIRELIDMLVERFDDPRADASDAEVASLARLLHDVAARDELLVQAVPPRRRESILRMLRVAVRRVPPPDDAPLCTALAWFAYADGDGTTANIALDRALDSDPDYSLALLIAASLARQLPPEALVEVMKGAARDITSRDAAG
jgi:hypothetical protein